MRLRSLKYCVIITCLLAFFNKAGAQQEVNRDLPTSRILLIYDCSNSMYAKWQSDSKINISKKLLTNIIDSLQGTPNLELALRVYGHQKSMPPIDCDDTKLEIPFGRNNSRRIIQKINSLKPKGATPIAASLYAAAEDFPPCDNCRNIIILITDGIEECGGDACAASEYLQSQGISFKPFIIGIGDNFSENFKCVGTYFDASKEDEFTKAFSIVISQALNSTTAQVNLLDADGRAAETNVNMTFYDHFSGKVQHNYVHTMNTRGLPDTITLDPLVTYDMVVQTIPSVRVDSIIIEPGKHHVIAADVPQGFLKVAMIGSRANLLKGVSCIVREAGKKETLFVQNVNSQERYLNGFYDLEILCMPRVYVNNVEIKQNTTTTVELPMSGIAVIQKNMEGIGSLYKIEGNEMQLIYNMNEKERMETLHLQPGSYKVVIRSKYFNRASSTVEKAFKIEPNMTTTVAF